MCPALKQDRPGLDFKKLPPNWVVLGSQAPQHRGTRLATGGIAGAARGWGGDGEEAPGKRQGAPAGPSSASLEAGAVQRDSSVWGLQSVGTSGGGSTCGKRVLRDLAHDGGWACRVGGNWRCPGQVEGLGGRCAAQRSALSRRF